MCSLDCGCLSDFRKTESTPLAVIFSRRNKFLFILHFAHYVYRSIELHKHPRRLVIGISSGSKVFYVKLDRNNPTTIDELRSIGIDRDNHSRLVNDTNS